MENSVKGIFLWIMGRNFLEHPPRKHWGILAVIFLNKTPRFLNLFLLSGDPEASLG